MKAFKKYFFLFIILLITSCKSKKKKNNFSLTSDKTIYQLGETIIIKPNSITDKLIDSISYTFQGKKLTPNANKNLSIKLDDELLGKYKISATIVSNSSTEKTEIDVTVLNNEAPKIYNYKIVNTYPHNSKHYTQGLEFKGDNLYESTGKYGKSKLFHKELTTGKTIKEHSLAQGYFGEGLTIVEDKIHQLTWKKDIGFTYNIDTFKEEGTFAYNKSKQGWGLCHSENFIFKSDGTTKIWKLNKETLAEESYIQVATNTAIKSKFNELEWIDGKIYANTYQKPSIAIINPKNGAIEGIINLKGLLKKVGVDPNNSDYVLNGIAYKPKTKQLYVTGKYWQSLFEIKIVK